MDPDAWASTGVIAEPAVAASLQPPSAESDVLVTHRIQNARRGGPEHSACVKN
jgi:hypothetical protein